MVPGRRVVVVGAGDLGVRIALRLVACAGVGEVIVAGRDTAGTRARAHFIASCSDIPVRFAPMDALDPDAVAALIARAHPQLLVQCASMHSPWLLSGREDPVAQAFRSAGFASQLPAQLPALLAVMRGVRQAGFDGAVVNCSFPDVTHAALQGLALAPTIGIGNAGMIHLIAQAALRARGDGRRLRTLAHHAHVSMVAAGVVSDAQVAQRPRMFLDNEEVPAERVLAGNAPLPLTRELNEITAAHAVQVIAAYLGLSAPLHTAAPGVAGLPGGWPVVVSRGVIDFDLPASVTQAQLLEFNQTMGRMDGVERIDADGTVHFTTALQAALESRWPELAQPLRPDDGQTRYAQLRQAVMLAA